MWQKSLPHRQETLRRLRLRRNQKIEEEFSAQIISADSSFIYMEPKNGPVDQRGMIVRLA